MFLSLLLAATIHGTVYLEKNAMPGVAVHLQWKEEERHTMTDVNGHFRFDLAAIEPMQISAELEDFITGDLPLAPGTAERPLALALHWDGKTEVITVTNCGPLAPDEPEADAHRETHELPPPHPPPPPMAEPRPRAQEGVVMDLFGQPLPGVLVLGHAKAFDLRSTTDRLGRYDLIPAETTVLRIEFIAPGHVAQTWDVSPGSTVGDVTLAPAVSE